MAKDLLIIAPYPQKMKRIFSNTQLALLRDIVDVRYLGDDKVDYDELDRYLADAVGIIGQMDLPAERLTKGPKLKAIFNVEGNFYQNIDYGYCFREGIHVLNCGEAFALPVAEMALGFALDLSRGITEWDKKFRTCSETYLTESCKKARLIRHAKVGFIGFGLIGKYLIELLQPFACDISIYDPWIPESVIHKHKARRSELDSVLSESEVIFILAGVTKENRHFINREKLALIQKDTIFLLMSRAAVIDFDALADALSNNNFKAAIDVFPEEPLKCEHKLRKMDNVLLSSHRAGAIPQAYEQIGEMIIDDLRLITRGLPPVVMQQAKREIVTRMENKPSEE